MSATYAGKPHLPHLLQTMISSNKYTTASACFNLNEQQLDRFLPFLYVQYLEQNMNWKRVRERLRNSCLGQVLIPGYEGMPAKQFRSIPKEWTVRNFQKAMKDLPEEVRHRCIQYVKRVKEERKPLILPNNTYTDSGLRKLKAIALYVVELSEDYQKKKITPEKLHRLHLYCQDMAEMTKELSDRATATSEPCKP